MEEDAITRREFLKAFLCGALGVFAFLGLGGMPAVPQVAGGGGQGGAEVVKGRMAPEDRSKMWLNTGSGDNMLGAGGMAIPAGAMCYYDEAAGGWKPTTATWA